MYLVALTLLASSAALAKWREPDGFPSPMFFKHYASAQSGDVDCEVSVSWSKERQEMWVGTDVGNHAVFLPRPGMVRVGLRSPQFPFNVVRWLEVAPGEWLPAAGLGHPRRDAEKFFSVPGERMPSFVVECSGFQFSP